MLSSSRQSPHRRRSQSASTPLTSSRRLSEEKKRITAKRPRPTNPHSPLLKDIACDQSQQKWDVDRWRKGKRVRRDSASPAPTSRGPCLFGSSSVFRNELGPLPASGLPSTSDAFDFFPVYPGEAKGSPHIASTIPETIHNASADTEPGASAEVERLRSEAFCELQRSVAEGGEGLVSRMRDWEQCRSTVSQRLPCPDVAASGGSGKGSKYSAFNKQHDWNSPCSSRGDEDDDIQIVSGPSLFAVSSTFPKSFSQKPRPNFEGAMDVDEPEDYTLSRDDSISERCWSPIDAEPSGHASEDEAPALSFSYTTSTNSSSISLSSHPQPTTPALSNSVFPLGMPTSPSEKAIAALTLVMANGAGGLNDYEAVRALEEPPRAPLDESLVGEMWH